MAWRKMLEFPNPVDEHAARVVAGGVLVLATIALASGSGWLMLVLALGFAARTASGPRFSALGQLATRVVAPRLGPPRLVPGPPKRFAQGIGLVLTCVAATASLGFGAEGVATALIAVLLVFATLEAVVGFCAGCWVFGRLMQIGLIPAGTCEACANIASRYAPDRAY